MPLTVTQLQKTFPQIFEETIKRKEPQIIFKHAQPSAVLLDYQTYSIFLGALDGLLEELEEKGRFFDAFRETRGQKSITLTQLKKKYQLK